MADEYTFDSFTEDPYRMMAHRCRVWINGVEVTERLTSSVTVSYSGRKGHNTASFTLSNANDGFILSADNLNGEFATANELGGEYSENIKKAMFEYKNNESLNPSDGDTGCRRWPLEADMPVLHTLDCVFVAARWPYSQVVRWQPIFKGYIDNKPFSDDYIHGKKSVEISCVDVRELMSRMRVQMNYLISTETFVVSRHNLGELIASSKLNAYDPMVIDGLFSDLQLPNSLSTPIAGLSMEQTVELLVSGKTFTEDEWKSGTWDPDRGIGFVDFLFTYHSDLINQSVSGVDISETTTTTRTVNLELETEEVTATTTTTTKTVNVQGVGRFERGISLNWPIDDGSSNTDKEALQEWHDLCLFGSYGRPWTTDELEKHAAECKYNGNTAPHAGLLHFLLPKKPATTTTTSSTTETDTLTHTQSTQTAQEYWAQAQATREAKQEDNASGMRNVVEYTEDAGSSTREWESRLSIIEDYLEKLDYQWFVTPIGDIVVEFPTYDFEPDAWGNKYSNAFTFEEHGEVKTARFEDDKNVITSIRAVGRYCPTGSTFTPEMFNSDPAGLNAVRVTMYFPVLAGRFGMSTEPVSFPFVTDVCRLRQFAIFYIQRKLAESSELSIDYVYRPLILPNRPIFSKYRNRLSWTSSVNLSVSCRRDHGVPQTSCGLRYVRRYENGEYRLITGSKYMPLSYTGKGPDISTVRGVLVTEMYSPDQGYLDITQTNIDCPAGTTKGRSEDTEVATIADELFSEEALRGCSTDAADLSPEISGLWDELQIEVGRRLHLTMELVCTSNDSGTPHEDITPYGHTESNATAFDIRITGTSGEEGTYDDYVAVAEIATELGLSWGGGDINEAADMTEIQSKILERAEYHFGKSTLYVYGGDDTASNQGLDCSGFVVECYRYAGVLGKNEDLSASSLFSKFPDPGNGKQRPGDIAFYRSSGTTATHVAIVSSDTSKVFSCSGPGESIRTVADAIAYREKQRKQGQTVTCAVVMLDVNYRSDFVRFGTPFNSNTLARYCNHFYLA